VASLARSKTYGKCKRFRDRNAIDEELAVTTDTRAYRRLIRDLARMRLNARVSNGFPEHAAILFEAMFRHAKDEVRIFTGSLSTNVYGQKPLVRAAERFLQRPGTSLKVLFEEPADCDALQEHPLLVALNDEAAGALELRQAVGSYAVKGAKHFAVMDDCGFRFEHDHDATQAIANFNEPDVARKLLGAFDSAFEMGIPIHA
jgi:hypothetical protein